MRVQQIRIVMLHLRARCAMTRAGGKDADSWLGIAERDARSLRREKLLWADALAQLIEAALAFRRGQADQSRQILAAAAASLTAADMHMHAAVARRRLGQLLGGTQGQELVRQGEEWMNGQKVRNLDRMTVLLAPGWNGN
jgi:hypothetical protein